MRTTCVSGEASHIIFFFSFFRKSQVTSTTNIIAGASFNPSGAHTHTRLPAPGRVLYAPSPPRRPLFFYSDSGTALLGLPVTVGGEGRSQCVGLKVTVGRAKGNHSANKPGSSLCSSPFVRHGSATRGGGPLPSAAASLARVYLRCLKPCEPSGPRGCLITLLGCLVSSGWESLGGLQGERRSEAGVV